MSDEWREPRYICWCSPCQNGYPEHCIHKVPEKTSALNNGRAVAQPGIPNPTPVCTFTRSGLEAAAREYLKQPYQEFTSDAIAIEEFTEILLRHAQNGEGNS